MLKFLEKSAPYLAEFIGNSFSGALDE